MNRRNRLEDRGLDIISALVTSRLRGLSGKPNRSYRGRNSLILLILISILTLTIVVLNKFEEISVAQLLTDIRAHKIDRIILSEDSPEIIVEYISGEKNKTYFENPADFRNYLQERGIAQEEMPLLQIKTANWLRKNSLPLLLFIGVLIIVWFAGQRSFGRSNSQMTFGKSRARMFTGDQPTVTFDDIATADDAQKDLKEIIEFLKEPEQYITLGAQLPSGVLLVGPPGTGKTLIAKAISGEAAVPFFSIAGSDFSEMFVGVGASRVRDLFDQAKRHSPCIVFIDGIDSLGFVRERNRSGYEDDKNQALSQLLYEMDGFDTDSNVIVIGATDRMDLLDPGLYRSGRFDRIIELTLPVARERENILKIHVRGKPLSQDVGISELAVLTRGFSGADLENVINEAAILAARKNKKSVSMEEFYEAYNKIRPNVSRSISNNEQELSIFSYHKAARLVIANHFSQRKLFPIEFVNFVFRDPEHYFIDESKLRLFTTKSQFQALIVYLLSGYVAEKMIFHEMSAFSADGLSQANLIARKIVCSFGMNDEIGPRVYEGIEASHEISEDFGSAEISDLVLDKIDQEIIRILQEAQDVANSILENSKEALAVIAKEVLVGREFTIETLQAKLNDE